MSVTLHYHLISMGIKVSKPTPVFLDNMTLVLNATNTGSTLENKTVALRYHFIREHVDKKNVEERKIHTSKTFADTSTKTLVNNDLHGIYHEFMMNG